MDTELRDELDRCFGDGPPVDDTDLLLDRGRTALRRRRLVEGISMLAVAAVVTVFALASSASGPAASPDRPPLASSPAAVPAESVSFTVVTDPGLAEADASGLVELTPSHQLRVAPGVELRRIVVDPYDPAVYAASAALAYRWNGTTYWHLLYTHSDDTSTGEFEPARDGVDFDDWLAERVRHPAPSAASVVVDRGRPAAHPIGADARTGLHVAPGVRIVRLVTNPYPRVAPASSVAAIYVQDGEAYWFAAIMSDAGGSASSIPAGHGRTFDEWVADRADRIELAATGDVRGQR
jgi:hypothetical protein